MTFLKGLLIPCFPPPKGEDGDIGHQGMVGKEGLKVSRVYCSLVEGLQ